MPVRKGLVALNEFTKGGGRETPFSGEASAVLGAPLPIELGGAAIGAGRGAGAHEDTGRSRTKTVSPDAFLVSR
jgi:hypothetical protein